MRHWCIESALLNCQLFLAAAPENGLPEAGVPAILAAMLASVDATAAAAAAAAVLEDTRSSGRGSSSSYVVSLWSEKTERFPTWKMVRNIKCIPLLAEKRIVQHGKI